MKKKYHTNFQSNEFPHLVKKSPPSNLYEEHELRETQIMNNPN